MLSVCPSLSTLADSRNSIGNRKETPRWAIELWHCKAQLLVLLLFPVQLSVMVITSHLVPSWTAEWLKSEAPQLAAGFYMLPVSSIRPHLSHEGPLSQRSAIKPAFWHGHQYKGCSPLCLPFSSADGQDSWDNLVIWGFWNCPPGMIKNSLSGHLHILRSELKSKIMSATKKATPFVFYRRQKN